MWFKYSTEESSPTGHTRGLQTNLQEGSPCMISYLSHLVGQNVDTWNLVQSICLESRIVNGNNDTLLEFCSVQNFGASNNVVEYMK